ncbi:MAG: amidohydrolase [Lachnospiraceae bacterium]|nr:amidohydrolase [Lachnospiraceae bacterium]
MKIQINDVWTLIDGEVVKKTVCIDKKIVSVTDEIPADFNADTVIDGHNRLLMPGMVNSHTHAYMSVFRNLADDLAFEEWLFGRISPLEDKLLLNDCYWGNMLSCLEMIKSGTTCFVDMHMALNQSVLTAQETGMRAVITRGLVGSDRQDKGGKKRIMEAFEEYAFAQDNDYDRIKFMFGPHAIYTCGKDYLMEIAELAKEKGLGINIHLSETKHEVEECIKNNGMSPVKYVESLGLLDVPAIAAHCVYLDDEDILVLKNKGVSVATNPASNMKLGNGFAPVSRLIKEGVNVCLGTDSQASNNTLNMFTEMRLLSMIHKGVECDAQAMSAKTVLKCATENGYKAIGMGDIAGKIEAGKVADLVLLDIDAPQFYPRNNLASALVYSANGSEVDTVIIDGEIVMKNKEVLTIDTERVYHEINRITANYV